MSSLLFFKVFASNHTSVLVIVEFFRILIKVIFRPGKIVFLLVGVFVKFCWFNWVI